jgi:hypothetical protein
MLMQIPDFEKGQLVKNPTTWFALTNDSGGVRKRLMRSSLRMAAGITPAAQFYEDDNPELM